MADLADIAQEQIERDEQARKPDLYVINPGTVGDCDLCGEGSGRLIQGVCAPCRDRRRLP